MSAPATSTDRDALRRALHASLSDVLMDVSSDARSMLPQGRAPNSLPTGSVMQQNPALRFGGVGAFDSPLLPSRQQSLFSQSFGLPSGMGQNGNSMSGFASEDLLLSAATAANEKQLLDQARAAIFQQQIAQEKERLLQNSLAAHQLAHHKDLMMRGGFSSPFMHPGLGKAVGLPQQYQVQAEAPKQPVKKNANALEALGSSLRTKTDPYIDVSSLQDPNPEDSTLRRTRGGVSEPFPEKLQRMLQEVEEEGLSDVVSFYSHGRAFGVHDMDRFVSEVMPKYFKQSKWNSFARQLNLYGFIRITSGPDAGGYYHELFLKGRPNLCLHMRRVGVPQGEDRRKFRAKSTSADPDFYSMKTVVAKSTA